MKKVISTLCFLLLIFIYSESCSNTKKGTGISENKKTLKEVYSNAFLIRVPVNDAIVSGADSVAGYCA